MLLGNSVQFLVRFISRKGDVTKRLVMSGVAGGEASMVPVLVLRPELHHVCQGATLALTKGNALHPNRAEYRPRVGECATQEFGIESSRALRISHSERHMQQCCHR